MKGINYFVIFVIVAIALGGVFLLNKGNLTGKITGQAVYGIAGAPTISSVSISPSNPSPEDDLTGSISASDGEGDNISYAYNWYKDDALHGTTLITNGLRYYFPLDNDVLDYYGSNDGITVGGVTLTSSGKIDGAYVFDGDADYIQTADSDDSWAGQDFTISAWVKIPTLTHTNNKLIVSRHQSSSQKNFQVGIEDDNRLMFSTYSSCSGLAGTMYSTETLSTDTWYHVVYMLDSGTRKYIYLDGQQVVNGTTYVAIPSGCAQRTIIGANLRNNDTCWNGEIDEVLIFNRTLSATEIQQLYAGGRYGGVLMDSSETSDGEEWLLGGLAGDSTGWSSETNSSSVTVSADQNNPSISFSSSTTSEGEHNQDFIFVGVDLSDENDIYSFIDFNNSLVGFWKLNESSGSIIDYSSYGNDGTQNGGINYGASGKFGDAVDFDGSNDYINLGNINSFERTDSFTYSFWLNSTSTTNYQTIISKTPYGSWHGLELFILNNKLKLYLIGSSEQIEVTGTTVVNTGDWKHIIVTYNGSSDASGVKLYVNNVEGSSGSGTLTTSIVNSNDFQISCRAGANNCFDGSIDEFIVFDRVLSSDEISALYNASSYSHNFTDLEDGGYNFYAYVQDAYGNENQTSTRKVTLVSNAAPTITLISPEETLYTENESLNLTFTVEDDNDAVENLTCWYNIDGGSNVNISNCQNTTFDVADGASYTLTIYVNDSEGLEGSDNVNFDIDATGVSVLISEPTGTKSSRTNIPLQYSIVGSNITCWYNVKTSIGGNVIDNTTLVDCGSSSFTVSNDGDYVLSLFANNTLGSVDSDSSSFSVDTDTGGDTGGSSGGRSSRTTIIPGNLTTELILTSLSNIVINPGESKKIKLTAKNAGTSFLNDCMLESTGQYSPWINGGEIKDISAGEEYEFIFNIKIPEDAKAGKYEMEVNVICKEVSKKTEFVAEILEKKIDFEIKSVEREGSDGIKIVYLLKELSGIQQNIDLEFLLVDETGRKVLEAYDERTLEPNSGGEFVTKIFPDKILEGEHKILVNINSETYSVFVQEDVLLAPVSGFSVFGESMGDTDTFISVIVIIAFVVFAFFSIKRTLMHKKKMHEKTQ